MRSILPRGRRRDLLDGRGQGHSHRFPGANTAVPTANVDAGHQQQIIDLMRQTCREEDVALLLVTHTPEVAEQFGRVDRLEDFNQPVAVA